MDTKELELLSDLLGDFLYESKKLLKYDIKEGDGQQPLIYIAVRCFRGMNDSFVAWLKRESPNLGSLTPLQILVQDKESWVVRSALMDLWLERLGLKVPKPKMDDKWKKVTFPGGFISWVKV